jgi:hypothetical protein
MKIDVRRKGDMEGKRGGVMVVEGGGGMYM